MGKGRPRLLVLLLYMLLRLLLHLLDRLVARSVCGNLRGCLLARGLPNAGFFPSTGEVESTYSLLAITG